MLGRQTFNWQKNEKEKRVLVKSLSLTHTDEEIAVIVSNKYPEDGVVKKWGVTKFRRRCGIDKPIGGIQKGLRTNRNLNRLTEDDGKEKVEQGFVQLLQENRSLQQQLEKERLKTQKILEAVESAIVKLPPYKPPKFKSIKKKYSPEDMGLVFSDSQIGEKTTLQDSSGFSEYNFEIFKEECEVLKQKVLLFKDIHSHAYNIQKLWILGVGDFVSGEGIFPAQAHFLDHIVVDQVFLGTHIFASVIREWCHHFPKIKVVMVSGQHGRGSKDYHWRSNWDYVFGKVLQLLLKDVENCEVMVAESALCILEIKGHLFLLNHGNEIRSWMTVPFYGLERATLRWVNLARMPIDYVIIGDKHRNCEFDIAYTEAMINGAWSPGTKYSVDKMQGAGFPKQKVFGIHTEEGKTWSYDIKLAKPPRLEKDKKGFYTPIS